MVVRGTEYKEDYDFEGYGGEEVTAVLQPLVDNEFLPIAAFLASHLEMEDEIDKDEAVSEAIDKVEEAEEDGTVDVTKLDEEFVAIMQEAAKKGLCGGYDPSGSLVEYTDEEVDEVVENMMGAYSVEIGGRVLEISGDVRDAEKFRGGRGRVEHSRDS